MISSIKICDSLIDVFQKMMPKKESAKTKGGNGNVKTVENTKCRAMCYLDYRKTMVPL